MQSHVVKPIGASITTSLPMKTGNNLKSETEIDICQLHLKRTLETSVLHLVIHATILFC